MSTTSNNLTQFKAESPEAIMNSFDTKGSQKRSKRSKKIACTECRQQKAKCDASERQPHPCSRCEKRKIPCKLDSEFKRTFKRAKIDELVKEYEIIKSKLNSNMLNDTKQIPVQIQQQPPPLQQQQQPQPQPQAQTQQSFLPPIQYVSNSRANISGGNSYPIQASPSNGSPLNDTAGYGSAVPSNSYNNHATHVSSSGIPGSINRQMGPNISGSGNVKPATPLSTLNRQFSPFSMRPISPLGQDMSLISGMQLSSSYNQPIKSPVIVPTPGIQYSTNISSPNITNKINSSLNLSTLISAANASDNLSKGFTNGSAITASNNVNKQAATVSQLEPGKLSNLRVCRPVRKPKIDQSLLSCTPKSLGEVTLNEDQIVVLYSTFLTHYHPLLPVIDMEKSIEKIYKLCPILFWTMMFTALRGHHSLEPAISPEECKELYFTLSPVIKSVLAEITISPITRYAPSEADESILNASSVYSVQAFLIYTFWPPLTSSLSADSSWNSIGIAFYQAIRLGLHTPGLTSDRSKSSDLLNENIRTWIACNVVSQTIASVFGYPSFFQPYGSLTLALSKEGNDVPHCLRQMLEIQTFEEQIEKTLNSNSFDSLRLNHTSEQLPMIHLLENELNQLELKLCSVPDSPMDDFRMLSLYAARLHLLCYYFLDNDQSNTFEYKRGVIKAYNAALAIIQHCKMSNEREDSFIKNLPSSYILTLWQASVVISRLVNSSYKSLIDVEAGKLLYQTAISLALKASVVKHDLAYRSCGIMKATWNLFRTLDMNLSGPVKVTVRSRMSANIFFDTLWIVREKCDMIKLNYRKKSDSNSGGESDDDVEVIEDDQKVSDDHQNVVTNTLSGSVGSETRSSSKRKTNYSAENAARKIISTIPLDPQPISIAETPNDSTSNSKGGSPFASYKSPNTYSDASKKIITPQSLALNSASNYHSSPDHRSNQNSKRTPNDTKSVSSTPLETGAAAVLARPAESQNANTEPVKSESTVGVTNSNVDALGPTPTTNTGFFIDNWDLNADFDSDMLFKDIASVMDEFGFHAG